MYEWINKRYHRLIDQQQQTHHRMHWSTVRNRSGSFHHPSIQCSACRLLPRKELHEGATHQLVDEHCCPAVVELRKDQPNNINDGIPTTITPPGHSSWVPKIRSEQVANQSSRSRPEPPDEHERPSLCRVAQPTPVSHRFRTRTNNHDNSASSH